MTDKEQKIREEVQKIARSINPYIPDEEGKNSEYEAGRFAMVTQIMQIIDSLQEEPVYTDFTKALAECIHQAQGSVFDPMVFAELWKDELIKLAKSEESVSEDLDLGCGVIWKDNKKYIGEDLDMEITEEYHHFHNIDMLTFEDIARHFANWQKQQDMQKFQNSETATFTREEFDEEIEKARKEARQQIIKDAVEGEIVKDIANNLYIGKAKVNKNNFKFGDKVKLLVLKEE